MSASTAAGFSSVRIRILGAALILLVAAGGLLLGWQFAVGVGAGFVLAVFTLVMQEIGYIPSHRNIVNADAGCSSTAEIVATAKMYVEQGTCPAGTRISGRNGDVFIGAVNALRIERGEGPEFADPSPATPTSPIQ